MPSTSIKEHLAKLKIMFLVRNEQQQKNCFRENVAQSSQFTAANVDMLAVRTIYEMDNIVGMGTDK